MSDRKRIGPLGEELTVKFLVKHGYRILDRNYRRPWGELDIVAQKGGKIHFVEVKTLAQNVSCETRHSGTIQSHFYPEDVTHETQRRKALDYIRYSKPKDWYRPEEKVNRNKMLRLSRIIQTYLMGKHVSDETNWQFDVATVLVDKEKRRARVNLIENIIMDRR